MLDTGCPNTLITPAIFRTLPSRVRDRLRPTAKTFQGVSGHPLTVTGEVTLRLTLDRRRVQVSVIIVEMMYDGILGLETLMRLGVSLDLARGKLVVPDGGHPRDRPGETTHREPSPEEEHRAGTPLVGKEPNSTRLQETRNQDGWQIAAAKRTVLPPWSEMLVEGRTPEEHGEPPPLGLWQPALRGEGIAPLMMPVAVVNATERCVRSTMLNPTHLEVVLEAGTPLGWLREMDGEVVETGSPETATCTGVGEGGDQQPLSPPPDGDDSTGGVPAHGTPAGPVGETGARLPGRVLGTRRSDRAD